MNKYFNWPDSLSRFVRFDSARSEDVNAALDEVSAGLDAVDQDVRRAIKLPASGADRLLNLTPGQRANLLLGFDADGNVDAMAGGGRFRGDWGAGTEYAVAETFKDPASQNIYSAVQRHVAQDIAGDLAAGRIALVFDVEQIELARVAAQTSAAQATTIRNETQGIANAAALHMAQLQNAAQESADAAALSQQAAADSAQDSSDSASASAAALADFARRYLGPHSTQPTTDNQGLALQEGALYLDTAVVPARMREWSSGEWHATYLPAEGYQEKLVSEVNIKTVGGQSLLGAGDVLIGTLPVLHKTAAYTLTSSDLAAVVNCEGAWTLSAAPALPDGWWCYLRNAANGDIAVTPGDGVTIDGSASRVLKPGCTWVVVKAGGQFTVLEVKRRAHSRRTLITSSGGFVVPADTYVLRGYAVGAGAAGVNYGGAGGGMAYGDFAVTPGETISVSISSGVATVSRGGTALLVGNPGAPAAISAPGGTATKHASVTNGGAYAGGASASSFGKGGSSSGSPLGPGFTSSGTGGAGWGGAGFGGGGGVGGPANANGMGGPGLPQGVEPADPLLRGLDGVGGARSISASNPGTGGGPGAGGGIGGGGFDGEGGRGGFGGGGGGGGGSSGNESNGGDGGFGGGGGSRSSGTSSGKGNGGFGGGGSSSGGFGGPAAVILMWD